MQRHTGHHDPISYFCIQIKRISAPAAAKIPEIKKTPIAGFRRRRDNISNNRQKKPLPNQPKSSPKTVYFAVSLHIALHILSPERTESISPEKRNSHNKRVVDFVPLDWEIGVTR